MQTLSSVTGRRCSLLSPFTVESCAVDDKTIEVSWSMNWGAGHWIAWSVLICWRFTEDVDLRTGLMIASSSVFLISHCKKGYWIRSLCTVQSYDSAVTALPYSNDADEDHDNAEDNIGDGAWIPTWWRPGILRRIWHGARKTFTGIHDDFRA